MTPSGTNTISKSTMRKNLKYTRRYPLNISKQEQRVLHTLAMGGEIRRYLNKDGKLTEITCFTREGYGLSNCTMDTFKKLKNKKLISSKGGRPYRITPLGATSAQAQMNQR